MRIRFDRIWQGLVYATLLGSAVVLFVLAGQNDRLRRQVRRARVDSQLPLPGHVVPVFRATTTTGDTVTVGDVPPGGRQLLLIFESHCPYCLRTLPSWKTIVRRSSQDAGISARGISLDSLPDDARRYAADHGLEFPVVRFPDARMAGVYRAVGVPLTVVLGDAGVVVYGRAGELSDPAAVDSVLAALAGGFSSPGKGDSSRSSVLTP